MFFPHVVKANQVPESASRRQSHNPVLYTAELLTVHADLWAIGPVFVLASSAIIPLSRLIAQTVCEAFVAFTKVTAR